ncbi:YceI family protein [Glaciecola sp. 1036]|uniref:YceI family protein n=1 Tax=Alteromonadaceae TaxID=72275 RepID=UPI003D08A8AA
MRLLSNFTAKAILLSLAFISSNAFAQLTLNPSVSSVNFLSTKNTNITETHSFKQFDGVIDEQGKLTLNIDLASVETMIPIRNERMQKMLFNVADFAKATFSADLDKSLLALESGESTLATVSGDLTISGQTQAYSFDVVITGLEDGKVAAATVKPTVIKASEFGLDKGIEALREVAGLKAISETVPLTFYVVFE